MKTKVSIVRCRTYNPEEVGTSVRRAFDLLGGLSLLINRGEKVLLKPNILSSKGPDKGANTHIEIVRSCARLVKDCGALPVIGDNPGGSQRLRDVYDGSGFSAMAEEEGIEFARARDVRMVKGLPISSYFFECDKIINIPKMKTHTIMGLTGAVKNMYGAVSGLHKTECHKRFPKAEDFVHVLVDVFEAVMPQLVLTDAVVTMDGDGPSAGRLRSTGFLMAGEDSVAVDSVFSHLIGVKPLDILTTKEAGKRGLGRSDLDNIEILGEGVSDNLIRGFKLPRPRMVLKLPRRIIEMGAAFVQLKPYITEGSCKRCGICVESCPVSAISIAGYRLTVDYAKCIRCMCCHELCPYDAVELKRSMLARICRI